jgi:hypothetical protein
MNFAPGWFWFTLTLTMSVEKQSSDGFFSPRLTGRRAFIALAVAVIADLLQIVTVPVAWTFVQSAIDVVAMLIILPVIGFHFLLLPTFVIEIVPGAAALPTWTACVLAVIGLKKRALDAAAKATLPPVIEVAEVKPPQLKEPPPGVGRD